MKNTAENKFKGKNFSWLDIIKAIWYFLAEDRKKFIFYFFILLVIFFYDLVPIYIVGKIVDFFTTYTPGQSLQTFYFYLIFITVTYSLASLIRLYSKFMIGVTGRNAHTRAMIWGFERLTEFSLEWHNKENTGSKLQRIFTGAEAVKSWAHILNKYLLKIVANIFGVLIFFLFIDYKFTIFVFLYSVFFLFIESTMSKKIFTLSNELNKLKQSAGGVYFESANNMLAIKALGIETSAVGRVKNKEELSRDLDIRKSKVNHLRFVFFQSLNGVALGVLLLLAGHAAISQTITVGMILVCFTYFSSKLQGSFDDLAVIHSELIELRSNVGQMMPIFKETEFIKTGNEKFPKDWQKIEIKNASMEYGSGQTGLKDFNLNIKRNTKLGIAGISGGGKSTLAKIILGLYGLKSGSFKIGNKDYYSISHNETLSNITVVLQETELFNLSLRENITMMRGEDVELLNLAVEISQLTEVINRLPEGLESRIGEKGYMLSGGERQRLGIARAIYKNAPIMILDEATSSLDMETESRIMDKLLGEYGKDKTFLIIAHRLGTLKWTDKIAVMERGAVVEEGGYNELMNNDASIFLRMNREQKN